MGRVIDSGNLLLYSPNSLPLGILDTHTHTHTTDVFAWLVSLRDN